MSLAPLPEIMPFVCLPHFLSHFSPLPPTLGISVLLSGGEYESGVCNPGVEDLEPRGSPGADKTQEDTYDDQHSWGLVTSSGVWDLPSREGKVNFFFLKPIMQRMSFSLPLARHHFENHTTPGDIPRPFRGP